MNPSPLRGLRVADESVGIAGAYAARLLSEAGAHVVKVEAPAGDPLRRRGAHEGASGATVPLFAHLHDGHEQLVVDRRSSSDCARYAAVIADSAIILCGSDCSGVAPPTIVDQPIAAPPGSVTLRVSPFGSSGPWKERAANEFTLQAWSGKLGQGYAAADGRVPVAAGGDTGLWLAGAFAALGALAFHRHAARAGASMHVDLSVLECMVAVFGSDAIARQLSDGPVVTQPLGREIPSIHAASDGLVAFAIVTAQQWSDFCLMIGKTEWMTDTELATSAGRRRRGDAVTAAVDDWVGQRTTHEVTEHAALLRIPAGVVANGATVPTLDCYAETFSPHPSGFVQPRFPLRFSPTPAVSVGVPEVTNPVDREGNGERPLSGLRIADFTAFWAGPYASCLLALLGADVTHVESAKRPDGMRMRSARPPSDPTWLEWSSIFHLNNASKNSICIDMDHPEGLDLARRLIQRCDGVIENFSPRVMERFGLDGQGVAHLNADAVYVRMPAFGLDNPWRDRPAFQHTIEPLAGLAWISGYADRDPQPVMICDGLGGVHAAFGLLCGLRQRERTGRGLHVEVRLSEVAAAIAAEQSVTASAQGTILHRIGNHHRCSGPQGVYTCRAGDGPVPLVAISVDTEAQWHALRSVVGVERWRSKALEDRSARSTAAQSLDEDLARWCEDRDAGEVLQRLIEANVPVGLVSKGVELLANPQLAARGFFTTVEHPVCGAVAYPGLPMVAQFDAEGPVPCGPRAPAPMLGEHDDLIETMLGVRHDVAAGLRTRGVTGSRTTTHLPM